MRERSRGGAGEALAERWGNTPAGAAEPALLATVTDAAPPGFFGPVGPLHLGGAAGPLKPYRRITDPAAGARVWDAAERLLAGGVRAR
jgi:hypothetical protein